MSLFGSLMGDFDDEALIGNHMNAMNMQMRNMSRLINMGSLMPDPFNMLTPFGGDGGFNNHMMERHHASPMGGLFGFPAMPNMNRLLSADIGGNSGASFCSSSVISMSSGPDGRPQIYQATSSTKTGPGGIRETRKTVQDSSTGVKKMAIGHHIGERGHIIEKEQNLRSGENEERQEFINLEEEEAEEFDREFTTKGRMHAPPVEMLTTGLQQQHRPHSHHQRPMLALPAPPTSSPIPKQPTPPSRSSASATTTTAEDNNITAADTQNKSNHKNKQQVATISNCNTTPTTQSQRRAHRKASTSPLAMPRKPLRTPSSSPLAFTSTSHNASTSTSVHPHPYNASAARRNYRSKHSKQHQQQPTNNDANND